MRSELDNAQASLSNINNFFYVCLSTCFDVVLVASMCGACGVSQLREKEGGRVRIEQQTLCVMMMRYVCVRVCVCR